MLLGFLIASALLIIGLLIGIIKLNRIKNAVRPSIQSLFAMAIVTVFWNALAYGTDLEWLSALAHGMYFAATDWLVVTLLIFTEKYTKITRKTKVFKIFLYICVAADTISMVVNTRVRHVFQCKFTELPDGGTFYGVEPSFPAYALHLLCVYSLVVIVAEVLIVKTRQTLKLYRKKYEMVLVSFCVILLGNIGYRFVDLPIDISSTLYILLALAISYFALFYVPRGLVAKLLSFAIQDMDTGIICFDRENKCVYANTLARRMYRAEMDLSKFEKYFVKWVDGRKVEEIGDCSWREELEMWGKTWHYEVQFKLLLDNKSNFVGGFFSLVNRTEEVKALQKERYRATHDSLTKLFNSAGFFEEVHQLLMSDPEPERYIVCSDIKDFKIVNALFGVQRGDEILIRVAEIIKRESSDDTIYGRLSADRFVICIQKRNFDERIFRRYVREVSKMASTDVYQMHVHIGIYNITNPSMDVSVMCDRALMALSRIKESYQQIFSYYDEEMSNKLYNEKRLIREFDIALEEGQFQMFLQPQVSVDKKILGGEALVRWQHPDRGMVSPGEFIPVFEKSGYISKLDQYIWESACQQLQKWEQKGLDLHISVNISPKDFFYIDIYEAVTSLVKKYGVSPRHLKLEITETALMTEVKNQVKILDKLRKFGFDLELDDFGSGYSSLNTLKDIPVDVLKVDMGFLDKTEHEERGRAITSSVIAMAKKLGMSVITEGVETEEQVEFLTGAKCDMFQGYYFDKPMPVPEFEKKWLA